MRNKKGKGLIVGGLLLLVAAVGLSGYNLWEENRAAKSVDYVLEQMSALIPKPGDVTLPEGMLPDYVVAPEMEMPTAAVASYDYIGYLSIPALSLDLPVMSEWSYPNLKVSPCRYAGSAYKDGFVICAHNFKRHFGGLKDLSIGDTVQFVDMDGNTFDYVVAEIGQLNPGDTREMLSKDWALSLFTCTLGGKFRVTVRCDRAEQEPAEYMEYEKYPVS